MPLSLSLFLCSVRRAPPAKPGPPRSLCSCAPQLNPVVGYWDPLNLAEGEFWGDSTEATIGFLREVRCARETGQWAGPVDSRADAWRQQRS